MTRLVGATALACFTLMSISAQARGSAGAPFWSTLDRNGILSAGWVQVLPVLASACKLTLDNRELNTQLVDLSQTRGNASYATNLYWHLYLMDRHKATNTFVNAWKAHFGSDQKAACDTAENLWGSSGRQFPGVLKRVASLDTDATSTIPPNAASNPNCR